MKQGFLREAGMPVTDPGQIPDLNLPADLSAIDRGKVFAIAATFGMEVFPPG